MNQIFLALAVFRRADFMLLFACFEVGFWEKKSCCGAGSRILPRTTRTTALYVLRRVSSSSSRVVCFFCADISLYFRRYDNSPTNEATAMSRPSPVSRGYCPSRVVIAWALKAPATPQKVVDEVTHDVTHACAKKKKDNKKIPPVLYLAELCCAARSCSSFFVSIFRICSTYSTIFARLPVAVRAQKITTQEGPWPTANGGGGGSFVIVAASVVGELWGKTKADLSTKNYRAPARAARAAAQRLAVVANETWHVMWRQTNRKPTHTWTEAAATAALLLLYCCCCCCSARLGLELPLLAWLHAYALLYMCVYVYVHDTVFVRDTQGERRSIPCTLFFFADRIFRHGGRPVGKTSDFPKGFIQIVNVDVCPRTKFFDQILEVCPGVFGEVLKSLSGNIWLHLKNSLSGNLWSDLKSLSGNIWSDLERLSRNIWSDLKNFVWNFWSEKNGWFPTGSFLQLNKQLITTRKSDKNGDKKKKKNTLQNKKV